MSRHCFALALFSVLVVPGLSGCSVIGFTVGSLSDSKDAVTRVDTVLQEGIGPYENRIRFVTSSGDTCRGELLEVTRAETCEYRDLHARWQTSQQGGRFAPSLGETIRLILKANPRAVMKGTLIGFTEQAVVINTSSLYSARDLEIPFAEIDTVIDGNGNRTAGADLQRDANNRVLPSITILVVALNGRYSTFAMQDIRWVEVTYTKKTATGRIVLLVVGIALDVVIVGSILYYRSVHGID